MQQLGVPLLVNYSIFTFLLFYFLLAGLLCIAERQCESDGKLLFLISSAYLFPIVDVAGKSCVSYLLLGGNIATMRFAFNLNLKLLD